MTDRITSQTVADEPATKKKAPKRAAKRTKAKGSAGATSNTRKASVLQKPRLTGADLDRMQLRRMGFVATALTTCLLAVLGTCVYLQGCEHEAFLAEAERNYLRSMRLDTQRGDIFDRNGEALATSVEVDTVYANPRKVENPREVAQHLSEVLQMPVDDLYERLTAPAHFRYLKRQVTAEESERVRAFDFPGIMINQEAKRFYPKKELAGQLLGVVGFDSEGQEGIEKTFDSELRGAALKAEYHRDARGRYAMFETLPPVESKAGSSLQVTIDEKIQAIAEQELERTVVSSLALSGVAVVMDVPTGDVLAMAHYPRFNPNRYRVQIAEDKASKARDSRAVMRVRNRILGDQFEPGSTFKIFTLAAGLEEGVIGLDDKIDVQGGRIKVHTKWISDTHSYESDRQSVANLVKYSSNVGFIKIGNLVGRDRLWTYLRAFGFGQPPGTGLSGEHSGLLRGPRQWDPLTMANISFGQGVAVTPLQLTAAVAAIGNQGVLMQPRIVMNELDADGKIVKNYPPRPVRRVVSAETARNAIKALQGVVEFDGTGRNAWIYDYDVAGKTGTAQKPDTIAGGYAEDRWIASFVGLVPASRPRLAILVAVDEPQGLYYGGHVAAPTFKRIAEWSLNYLGVPPSYGSREHVRAEYAHRAGQPDVTAEGAYYDYPEGAQPGVDPDEPETVVVPDFAEMSLRKAVAFAHKNYLAVDVDGSGRAAGQSVRPGTVVVPWTRVTVYFRPDGGVGDP